MKKVIASLLAAYSLSNAQPFGPFTPPSGTPPATTTAAGPGTGTGTATPPDPIAVPQAVANPPPQPNAAAPGAPAVPAVTVPPVPTTTTATTTRAPPGLPPGVQFPPFFPPFNQQPPQHQHQQLPPQYQPPPQFVPPQQPPPNQTPQQQLPPQQPPQPQPQPPPYQPQFFPPQQPQQPQQQQPQQQPQYPSQFLPPQQPQQPAQPQQPQQPQQPGQGQQGQQGQQPGTGQSAQPGSNAAPGGKKQPYYINPFCPAGKAMQVLGAPSTAPRNSAQAECRSNIPGDPRARATDWEGRLLCNNWACCLCQDIVCGANGFPCEHLKIGDSGAIGVQNIEVYGQPSPNLGFNVWNSVGFAWQGTGAQVDCSGREACKAAKVKGKYVETMQCTGDFACQATSMLIEPAEGMNFQGSGQKACQNAYIEIVVTETSYVSQIGSIEFNGQEAAQGATVKLVNRALGAVNVRNLECMNPTACVNTRWIVEGNFNFENCDLQGVHNLHGLPPILQQCVLVQAGNFGFTGQGLPGAPQQFTPPGFAQQTYGTPPPFNQPNYQPPPAQPISPGQPQPPQYQTPPQYPQVPQTPQGPQTPAGPAGPTGSAGPSGLGIVSGPTPPPTKRPRLPPLRSLSAQSLICNVNQCAGRDVLVTPSNNFVMDCSSNCQDMGLYINAALDPHDLGVPVDRIDAVKCSKPFSCKDAVFNVDTSNGYLEWNDLRCEAPLSCQNLHIIAGPGVDIRNVDCQQLNSCQGCRVTQNGATTLCTTLAAAQNQVGFAPLNPPGLGQVGGQTYEPSPFGQPQAPPVPPQSPYGPPPPAPYGPYGPIPPYPWY